MTTGQTTAAGAPPNLPHVPLWNGAAYIVLVKEDALEIPARLVMGSVLALPRTHHFETLKDCSEIIVHEKERGTFCFANGTRVHIRLA